MLVFLNLLLLSHFVSAQGTTDAFNTRSSAGGTNWTALTGAATSATFGTALAKRGCPKGMWDPECIMGVGMIASAIPTALQARASGNASNQLRIQDPNFCASNPSSPICQNNPQPTIPPYPAPPSYNSEGLYGEGSYGGSSDGYDDSYGDGSLPDPNFYSAAQDVISDAEKMLGQYGIDAKDPKALEAAIAKGTAAAKQMGMDGSGGSGSGLSDDMKAMLAKAKKEAESKYRISSVGSEGSGGGRGGRGDGKGFDMNAFLKGIDDGKREPASLDGLNKLAGGEPIGLASDNIFLMATRRYQVKKNSNLFLPAVVPKK